MALVTFSFCSSKLTPEKLNLHLTEMILLCGCQYSGKTFKKPGKLLSMPIIYDKFENKILEENDPYDLFEKHIQAKSKFWIYF